MPEQGSASRQPQHRAPSWRLVSGGFGGAITIAGALGLRDPLVSMASFTAALMTLNQIAPPLLLLAVPRSVLRLRRAVATVFDPWVAVVVFVGLSVGVSLPGILDPMLANALYDAPLGLFELIAGTLYWGQVLPATRQLPQPWQAALLVWAGSIPMTVVAVVWMLARNVLYSPYLDVICRWNVPPLMDQKWAGFIMFISGTPLQLTALWLSLGLSSARSNGSPSAP